MPTFSSRVMRESASSTLSSTGAFGSRYTGVAFFCAKQTVEKITAAERMMVFFISCVIDYSNLTKIVKKAYNLR
jgi:hypothetical protein